MVAHHALHYSERARPIKIPDNLRPTKPGSYLSKGKTTENEKNGKNSPAGGQHVKQKVV